MSNNLDNTTLFLSQANLDKQFEAIRRDVEFKTGTNISRYPNIKRQFQKMAQAVNRKCSVGKEGVSLTEFNNKLASNAVNFFCKSIQQRSSSGNSDRGGNGASSGPAYNPSVGFTTMDAGPAAAQGQQYADMVSHRERQDRQATPSTFDQGGRIDAINNDVLSSGKRGNIIDSSHATSIQQNPLHQQLVNSQNGRLNLRTSGAGGSSQPGAGTNMNNNGTPNVLPFDVSDAFNRVLASAPGEDLPLYSNVDQLLSQSGEDESVDQRAERIAAERRSQISDSNTRDPNMTADSAMAHMTPNYASVQTPSNQNIDLSPEATVGDYANVDNTNAISLFQSQVQSHDRLQAIREAGEAKLLEQMTARGVGTNRMRPEDPLGDKLLLERILEEQRSLQPTMMEVEHYVKVNSIDRDWYNTSDRETRYNFRVKFRAGPNEQGAHINELFRNVLRIELVQAILPQDNVLLPFDTRPYLDVLHFPHLVMQVEGEGISEVIQGTNTEYDRAFSILVFDKKHDSAVLSSDFISGSSDSIVNSAPKNQTNRQYNKGWYKYIPAYFEKKVFHNQPLAKLGHLQCRVLTDKGQTINALQDVLQIEDIVFTSAISGLSEADFEYDLTHSYPNDASASSRKYVRIQTTNCFSNKQFRLGDNIRIKGYDLQTNNANNAAFVSFINRDEGHYVLNTDVSNLAVGENQGYTCNLYISPPGELNSTLTGLDESTYQDGTDIDTSNYSDNSNIGRLINGNLQTHYLFRIVTRQGDVGQYTKPMNIN